MSLSPRLCAVADLLPAGMVVLDVGSDHGQLPIYLATSAGAAKIYASENKPGPYARLCAAVQKSGCNIETYLASGLESLPSDVGAILITGMGGRLIASILTKKKSALFALKNKPLLILEPQSEAEIVRETLVELGYFCDRELYVKECGKYYPLMRAYYSPAERTPLTAQQLRYGRLPLESGDPLLLESLTRMLEKLPVRAETSQRRAELERLIKTWNHVA